MTALLKDPLARLFQKPLRRTAIETVEITIEAMGNRWWMLHRSDGRSGGVFDDRRAALAQAKFDVRAFGEAFIVTIDSEGVLDRQRYVQGIPAQTDRTARLRVV